MHCFKDSKLMPYEAKIIKDVIMDVEQYPNFLPWCSSSNILTRNDDFITVKLGIIFKGFSESYISRIRLEETEEQYTIFVDAISGPFEFLKNVWIIKKGNKLTKVDFSIDFKLKSKILDIVIGMVFSSATEKMIMAFEKQIGKLSCKIV